LMYVSTLGGFHRLYITVNRPLLFVKEISQIFLSHPPLDAGRSRFQKAESQYEYLLSDL
jgi:hypothetical protein